MKNFAYLKQDSVFHALFPAGVPIKALLPGLAVCEGDGQEQGVYMVDLDQLRPEEFEGLVKLVHAQCDPASSLDLARREIRVRGLPLRAKHVASVTWDTPFFL